MLTEKTRVTVVTGSAESGDYAYNVEYSIENGSLVKLVCTVTRNAIVTMDTPAGKQDTEEKQEIGIMFVDAGKKQIAINDFEDTTPHVEVFETILQEVKTSLIGDAK